MTSLLDLRIDACNATSDAKQLDKLSPVAISSLALIGPAPGKPFELLVKIIRTNDRIAQYHFIAVDVE